MKPNKENHDNNHVGVFLEPIKVRIETEAKFMILSLKDDTESMFIERLKLRYSCN